MPPARNLASLVWLVNASYRTMQPSASVDPQIVGVSGCPLPQWLGTSSPRVLRRSAGKVRTFVSLNPRAVPQRGGKTWRVRIAMAPRSERLVGRIVVSRSQPFPV
jgi:hypothetical protein